MMANKITQKNHSPAIDTELDDLPVFENIGPKRTISMKFRKLDSRKRAGANHGIEF